MLIVHVDMDAFFASVEQLDSPAYRGKPLVVGADPKQGTGRGVVAAASYEARRYGIHSAMPISQAFRRCPQAVFVRPRFERYSQVSLRLFQVLKGYSEKVEPLSIDEAFLDCSDREDATQPKALALRLKASIFQATGISASIGVAANKSVAKIASDMNKPNGITLCPPGHEQEFLAPLPVKKLWGVGEKTRQRLLRFHVATIGALASMEPRVLHENFGKWGSHLYQLANGIDDREVVTERIRRSISEERTFSEDRPNNSALHKPIRQMAESLAEKMKRKGICGRTLVFKIRFENFQTFTRSKTTPEWIDEPEAIFELSWNAYRSFNTVSQKIRLLGIGITHLKAEPEYGQQLELFASGI